MVLGKKKKGNERKEIPKWINLKKTKPAIRCLPPSCSASTCEVADWSRDAFWSSAPSHLLPRRKAGEDEKADTGTSWPSQTTFLSGQPPPRPSRAHLHLIATPDCTDD